MTSTKSTPIQLPLAIDGLTVEIPLTKGYATVIDAVDVDLAEYKWHVSEHKSGLLYAVRTVKQDNKRAAVRLHRIILSRVLGFELTPDQEVDHVRGNGLLNTRENLRLASHAENVRNRATYKNNSSGIRGVRWRERDHGWVAGIRINGKGMHLGTFDSQADAIAARLAAEREYFGEFAPSLSRDK
jgi:hypothetical protein